MTDLEAARIITGAHGRSVSEQLAHERQSLGGEDAKPAADTMEQGAEGEDMPGYVQVDPHLFTSRELGEMAKAGALRLLEAGVFVASWYALGPGHPKVSTPASKNVVIPMTLDEIKELAKSPVIPSSSHSQAGDGVLVDELVRLLGNRDKAHRVLNNSDSPGNVEIIRSALSFIQSRQIHEQTREIFAGDFPEAGAPVSVDIDVPAGLPPERVREAEDYREKVFQDQAASLRATVVEPIEVSKEYLDDETQRRKKNRLFVKPC